MSCLDETEIRDLRALVDCLIPADEIGPSGSQCGVVSFIIAQLSGPFGTGAGTCVSSLEDDRLAVDPEAMSPLRLYRAGLSDLDAFSRARHAAPFVRLHRTKQDDLLQQIESGGSGSARLKLFFELALTNAYEGFFADPVHGGNRAAISWRMIGFPGCGHDHTAFVGRDEPVSDMIPVRTIADVR